jgi:mersacidin/lichenicidin family type 2 lantibiotic
LASIKWTVDLSTKSIEEKEHTMAYREIIRVRKNKEHRQRLSEEQPAVLPEQPAVLMELADAELGAVQGAGTRVNGTVEYRFQP